MIADSHKLGQQTTLVRLRRSVGAQRIGSQDVIPLSTAWRERQLPCPPGLRWGLAQARLQTRTQTARTDSWLSSQRSSCRGAARSSFPRHWETSAPSPARALTSPSRHAAHLGNAETARSVVFLSVWTADCVLRCMQPFGVLFAVMALGCLDDVLFCMSWFEGLTPPTLPTLSRRVRQSDAGPSRACTATPPCWLAVSCRPSTACIPLLLDTGRVQTLLANDGVCPSWG